MYLSRSKNPRKHVKLTIPEYLDECRKSIYSAPDIFVDLFVVAENELRLMISTKKSGDMHMVNKRIHVTWYREELIEKKEQIRRTIAKFKNKILNPL